MIQVLVVDQEVKSRRDTVELLKTEGYTVMEAADGQGGMELFDAHRDSIQLVMMDMDLPQVDGWHFLQHIRRVSQRVGVMVLTGKPEEQEQLMALGAGADDYIAKSVNSLILRARTRALLKRTAGMKQTIKREYGHLVVDQVGHVVTLRSKPVALSPKEYALLVYLTENEGNALSREQLLNVVWGYDYFGDLRTLDTHVKNVRAKLGDYGKRIKTLRGYGYKFE